MYCIMLIEGEESLLQCILPQIIREANKYSYSHPRTQPPRITNYPNKLGLREEAGVPRGSSSSLKLKKLKNQDI